MHCFEALAEASALVLAVSGGPDSTALLHLAAAWRPTGLPIHVATVDHGLRPEARAEAEAVGRAAARLGLPATILPWLGQKPQSRLQERARVARYDLLSDHARATGASHVVTAHTLDDQAETLLMRLAAGSGPRGLAGMRRLSRRGDLVLARPFLDVRKPTLVALCRDRAWPFVEDPANADPRFARARWRGLVDSLAAEGLTAERLGQLATRLARAETALDLSATLLARACGLSASPDTRLFTPALFDAPEELILRVLAQALDGLSPETAPRLRKLEALLDAMCDASRDGRALTRTIQGCIVAFHPVRGLRIAPEPPRRRPGTPASSREDFVLVNGKT